MPNLQFDRVVCVNLDRHPDRWDRFTAQVRSFADRWPMPIPQRVRAIDGERVGCPGWLNIGGGAWGCYSSHRRVIEDALMDGVEQLMIFEDDAHFPEDFVEQYQRFLHHLPADWDGLYLGGQHLHRKVFPPMPVNEACVRVRNVNRTHAFALRGKYIRRVYKHLCDYAEWIKCPNHHIDHRLGVLGEKDAGIIYAPDKWIVGQAGGVSAVSGKRFGNPRDWNKLPEAAHMPFVVVIGLHSSGSSCIAGVLHKLGVSMGQRLGGHKGKNPKGGFEAQGLARLCETAYPFPTLVRKIPTKAVVNGLRKHIQFNAAHVTRNGGRIHGGKYPHLCLMGPELARAHDDLLIVHINRPLDESIASLQERAADKHDADTIDKLQRILWAKKHELLATFPADRQIAIEYEDLLGDTVRQVDRLIAFLKIEPTDEQLRAALDHVDPACRRFNLQAAGVA